MSFRKETEMAPPVIDWLLAKGVEVKREFRMPWGICDLIGCRLDEDRVILRLGYAQKNTVGPLRRMMVLQHIPDIEDGRCTTLKGLVSRFSGVLLEAELQYHVNRLLLGKFLIEKQRGHYCRLNGWMPLQRQIIAVELKLSRADEALWQADLHKSVTPESYVALPLERARRLSSGTTRKFKQTGVGLLGVASSGCELIVEHSSREARTDPLLQACVVESFWRSSFRYTTA